MNIIDLLKSAESKPYHFPREAFDILFNYGYLKLPRFRETFIQNNSVDETKIILQDLIDIGYSDLAVGRIYEGHINALLIIEEYGTDEQKQKYFKDAQEGEIFGIWNSERPTEPMTFKPCPEGIEIFGAKTFCSGSLDVTRPIITAYNEEGKQMIILEIENHPNLNADKDSWNVIGMESTVSHRIDFSNLTVRENQLIGSTNDYDKEPMISTGAIRFAAVQFGGAKAIADIVIKILNKSNRSDHPIQNRRIAELGILVNSGQLWFDSYKNIEDNEQHINYVNMVRTDILRICEAILSLSEKAIGVQGFLKPNPFEKKYRDLKVYLKQPNPDLAMEKIGKYYSAHGRIQ